MFDFLHPAKRIVHSTTPTAVEILFLTYNRLHFTRQTLPALLDSSQGDFSVTVIDNASCDGTPDYLASLSHPRLKQIVLNKTNRGIVQPTRWFWRQSPATFVGKIDNDILVPQEWIENLVQAHQRIPKLGVVGYCHFRCEDFDAAVVAEQVSTMQGAFLRVQPWIGGNYLAKRSMFISQPGYHQSRRGLRKRILCGFNSYQVKLAKKGYIHGYLCDNTKQLHLWEHLDDPRSSHWVYDEQQLKVRNLSPEQIISWYQRDARELLERYQSTEHAL
jgi:glycosyltransferase involved in cell wall biosynthesis